ncbi:cysteinyl-tRNA synthetase, partial [Borealophlyctis nickersoniae]
NWNLDLKYLNLSGNKRLEIKPSSTFLSGSPSSSLPSGFNAAPPTNSSAGYKVSGKGAGLIQPPATSGALVASTASPRRDLTDFNALTNLRLLGLMDVTCLIVPPDESMERRVRTTSSEVPMVGVPGGTIRYGVADVLARPTKRLLITAPSPEVPKPQPTPPAEETPLDVFGVWDLVVPKFRGKDNEALFGVFDGRGSVGGTRMAKYLFEWFGWFLTNELEKLEREPEGGPAWHGKHGGSEAFGSRVGQGTASVRSMSSKQAHQSRHQPPQQASLLPPLPPQQYESANDTTSVVLEPSAIMTALRRTFLALNRELGAIYQAGGSFESPSADRSSGELPRRDGAGKSGGSSRTMGATPKRPQRPADVDQQSQLPALFGVSVVVVFMYGSPAPRRGGSKCTLYVANVGDGLAVMSKSGGLAHVLSHNHMLDLVSLSRASANLSQMPKTSHGAAAQQPEALASPAASSSLLGVDQQLPWPLSELARVQSAGGWFGGSGQVNGKVDLTTAFGYFPHLGAVQADPWIQKVELDVGDEGGEDGGADEAGGASGEAAGSGGASAAGGGDEFVVLASAAVWRAVNCGGTYEDGGQMVVDIARSALVNVVGGGGPGQSSGSNYAPSLGGIVKSQSTANLVQSNKPSGGGWGTAATKVRDVALSFGGNRVGGGYLVMVLGLRDLAKRSAWWGAASARRGSAESSNESVSTDGSRRGTEGIIKDKKRKGGLEEIVGEMMMKEISPPVDRLALVFTDIKNSTSIWENNPIAMRAALRQHHLAMRRLLRQCGGYEVKTEGDAFMVSFQNVLQAVEWCLTVQGELLTMEWPAEILACPDGDEIWWQRSGEREFVSGEALAAMEAGEGDDSDVESDVELELSWDGTTRVARPAGAPSSTTASARRNRRNRELIFRGLSVRMGIHFGTPLCEVDPITSRMDYYGPMVNRAARVTGASQGGQILISSDAMKEMRRKLGYWCGTPETEPVRSGDDLLGQDRPEDGDGPSMSDLIARLRKLGIVTWLIGEVKLKGLETPEVIYAIYRRELSMRHRFYALEQSGELEIQSKPSIHRHKDSSRRKDNVHIDRATVQALGGICLRLEWLAASTGDEGPSPNKHGSLYGSLPASAYRSGTEANSPSRFEWVVDEVDEDDSEGLLRVLESITGRIENAVSILYLTHSPFSRVLQSLGEAIDTDPNHLLRGLQMYAEQLQERKERKAREREARAAAKDAEAAAKDAEAAMIGVMAGSLAAVAATAGMGGDSGGDEERRRERERRPSGSRRDREESRRRRERREDGRGQERED